MRKINRIISAAMALSIVFAGGTTNGFRQSGIPVTASAETSDSSYSSEELCTDYFYGDLIYEYSQSNFDGEFSVSVSESSGYKDVVNMLSDGILGATVEDLNNDGICELLVTKVTSFEETYRNGKVISLQVYSPNADGEVVLMDEIELSRVSNTSLAYYLDIVSVVTSNDGQKYILAADELQISGSSKKTAVLKLNSNCKFEVSDFFIDPGYTSGLGLYHTDSIAANKIASVSYSELNKLYEVDAPASPDFDTYYQLMNDKLSKYGLSVMGTTQSSYTADFDIGANNFNNVSAIIFQRSFTSKRATGVIDVYFPYAKCGENADWSLDEDTGVLTISGTGSISATTLQWKSDYIKKVVIEDGITQIDGLSFAGFKNLTEVIIPDSVTSIGGNAFEGTPWLKARQAENPLVIVNGNLIDAQTCSGNVVIPDSVKSISYYAFYSSKVASVTIPDGVISIEYNTFSNCSNLTSITIPESVTSIYEAFDNCENLSEITILNPDCEISDYSISNGYDYDKGEYYFNGTIYGYTNSTAQAYADKNGFNFQSLGDAPDSGFELGDLNNDNLIDAVDATAILIEYAEMSTSGKSTLSVEQKKSADVNSDGIIDSVDATFVLSYYAEISTGGNITLIDFIEKSKSNQ